METHLQTPHPLPPAISARAGAGSEISDQQHVMTLSRQREAGLELFVRDSALVLRSGPALDHCIEGQQTRHSAGLE